MRSCPTEIIIFTGTARKYANEDSLCWLQSEMKYNPLITKKMEKLTF